MELPSLLSRAHASAQARAAADDAHPAFVRLVLDEGSVAAEVVLARLWPAEVGAQVEVLREHAGSLWRRAPEELLEVLARLPPGTRAERLAALLPAGGERVAALARAALGEARSSVAQARALLAMARVDGECGAAAMALLAALRPGELARLVAEYGAALDPPQRAVIRGLAAGADGRWSAELLLALARVGPPEEALADAEQGLERMAEGPSLALPERLVALARAVPFAALRPWIDAHLRAAKGPWSVISTVPAWASLAAPDQLDAMVEAVEACDLYPVDRARLLATLSRWHAARRGALLGRAREELRRSPAGAAARRVHAMLALAAASAGDERRELQRAALELVASGDVADAEPEASARRLWSFLGEHLDPGLRERCVETLSTFADRWTCWMAIGSVVAGFPAEERGLGLRALRRISDPTPPALARRVREALALAEASPCADGSGLAALERAFAAGGLAALRRCCDSRRARAAAQAGAIAARTPGDAAWAARVGELFVRLEEQGGDLEDFWALVWALAPALVRVAGPALHAALDARLPPL